MRGSPLLVALFSSVLTAGLLLLSDFPLPTSDCTVLGEWWSYRHGASLFSANASLPLPPDPHAVTQLSTATYDALKQTGWRSGVRFARFLDTVELSKVLEVPHHHTGALLLILGTGSGTPTRRGPRPFLSAAPSAANLTATLPLDAINAAAAALEKARRRQLFPFTLEAAPLRSCRSGDGPCAVWEVASGRLVLDTGLIERIAGASEARPLLAQFAGEAWGQVQAAAARLAQGQGGLATLSNLFAAAGPAALSLLMAGGGGALPIWFCVACPAILGLLAPFVFNFGLTSAAEQVCVHFQLPEDQCDDLWWGAFSLALVLSLASAIPIVYICRLPECIKHIVRPY